MTERERYERRYQELADHVAAMFANPVCVAFSSEPDAFDGDWYRHLDTLVLLDDSSEWISTGWMFDVQLHSTWITKVPRFEK